MIIFVVPLVSQYKSKNWELTTALLQGTLDSIANQSDSNYRVVVSCHEIPNIKFRGNPENLIFLPIHYSPLENDWCQSIAQIDRFNKCCFALFKLKDEAFNYCMVIDADDRVHRDLVKFLNEQPQSDGWVVDQGYQVDYHSNRSMKYQHLSQICGSTMIFSKQVLNIPQAPTGEEYGKSVYRQGHQSMREDLTSKGFSLQSLPFYGVQYVLNHGINDSDLFRTRSLEQWLKHIAKFWIMGGKMSIEQRRDFGYLL